ncbi:hypothetical protein BN946_scf184858.g43 [Trametes cinnabarina]|uniref:Uncharacterized protein n=1 Tax=Pycnoporus cinnabarinus TaxID=5643 RepID=A0A060ST02_PYCCI|nr:hypothetical protein BN946_scf184858.g43 [Trametes cinnabarina]
MATLNIAKYLTPPMPDVTAEYDGLEFRWRFITFRPAYFKNELYFIAAALLYVVVYLVGKQANRTRARKWFDEHLPIYQAQFSKPTHATGLVQDGNSDFFVFSTGRRALTSLHTTFTLRPRHDLFQYLFQVVRGLIELDYKVYDEVELEFTFREPAGKEGAVPECVWAVVAKDELKKIRDQRWDLTFTKTTDSPSLPATLAVMSEFADVTANLLKPYGTFSLPALLASPAIQPRVRR